MDRSIVEALAGSQSLSPVQLLGVITVASRLEPTVLPELAARSDLDIELRTHLLQEAPRHLVVDLLNAWPPDPGLVTAAAGAHGAMPDLVAHCGAQGWDDLAGTLSQQLDWTDIMHTAYLWSQQASAEMPAAVRVALVHAGLTEREPRPDLSSMSQWEKREMLERLEQEHAARHRAVWSLIERHSQLWESLAHDEQYGGQLQRILLEHADELTDEVLLACRPEIVSEQLRGAKYIMGIRLERAAELAQRWPRLRVIAQADLDRLVREVIDAGWTPAERYTGPDWPAIAALAEISDDTQLLSSCIAAIRSAQPPARNYRDREREHRWSEQRADTLAALATNPHVPRDDLIALVPLLDQPSLEAIHERSHGELRDACSTQLARLRHADEVQRPRITSVPDDDELTALEDPVSVLQAHLKHLKHRAAQRDATIDALLRSRFTTPDMLRALPAFRVLDSPEQAGQVAGLIVEVCGNSRRRWDALPGHCDPPPDRKTTFGAWLEQLASI